LEGDSCTDSVEFGFEACGKVMTMVGNDFHINESNTKNIYSLHEASTTNSNDDLI